jgi:hypothetical protein
MLPENMKISHPLLRWSTPVALALAFFGARAHCVQAQSLVLVAPGHTTALIVADDWGKTFGRNPLASSSYIQGLDSGPQQILKRYFKAVTGQDVVLLRASQVATPQQQAKYQTRIWCDRQAQTDRVLGQAVSGLDDDGFIISARGNDLYLTGKNWWGSVWAAYELLERYAGCGFYGPGGKGSPFIVVPHRDTVAVPEKLNLVENPTYRSRWFRLAPWDTFRLRERDKFHHNLSNIIPPSLYRNTHPEYFPIIDGKRWIPPAGRDFDFEPNVAAPGLVELVANAAIKYFDENPGAGSFSLGMNDSNKFCDSDACLAGVPANIADKEQRIAYSFFDFYNKIARLVEKKYPDKRLGFLAYGDLRSLPVGAIKLNPMLVPYTPVGTANLFNADTAKTYQTGLDRWADVAQRMGVYEYAYGGGFVIPRIYNGYLISNVRRQYGAAADGFYAEAYPNWGLDGPKYWLLARELWDTKQDPQALLTRYYTDMFGTAAQPMRAYFDYLEQVWVTQQVPGKKGNYWGFLDPIQLKIFTPQDSDHAWALLEAAKGKTNDPAALQRIKYFQDTFALTRALVYRDAATDAANAVLGRPKLEKTLPEWMPALLKAVQLWEEAPSLDEAIAGAKSLQPSPLNDTSWNALGTFTKNPVGALQSTSQSLNLAALLSLKENKLPLNEKNITQAVAAQLSPYAKVYPEAVRELKSLAQSGTLVIPALAKAPTIDGKIGPDEWPGPVFSGQFRVFNSLDKQPENSVVYAGWKDKTLYLAFDLQQDPATVGGGFTGMDRGGWKKPAMLGDDAVVINFNAPGTYMQSVRVNANGAIGTVDNGGKDDDFQTAIQAGTSRTAKGWQLELAVDLTRLHIASATLNKGSLLLPMARYTRYPLTSKPGQPVHYRTDVSTFVPAAPGRFYPSGNFTSLMSFNCGPWLVFGN